MDFAVYSKIGKYSDLDQKSDRVIYRFFEMLPGILAWVTLILIVILSFASPIFIALFIILFDTYWFIKTLFLSLHLRSAFGHLRGNLKINWLEKLDQLIVGRYSLPKIKSWRDIYHFIVLPTYKEGIEVVSATIESILRSEYPKSRMIVILAQEERGGEESLAIKSFVEKEYGNKFFKFLVVRHPANIPGELAGKGSNATFAARIAKEQIIDKLGVGYDHIIVSNLDIDTVVPSHYFSRLTYLFLTTPDPLKVSYQPVPLYTNNIWEAPALARVVAFSATFWHTIQQERPERLTTFSSHSMSFQALVDIDFWQVNMVSEDSRIFWQCFLRYNGDYRVVPMLYPVSMDANVASSFWRTLVNIYKQQRRWSYGVENVPYFLFGFLKNKLISKKRKLYYTFNIVESFHSWATNALIIFLLGWLPVMVGGPEFNRTVLSLNLPRLTSSIMSLAMIGLISSAVLSIIILPPRPPRYGKYRYVMMVLQWILFPVTTILLGALPGLESQTRLMLGKYMGFWVTPKTRRLP
jgi:cellulose synthase/poly-beta-1,6-N-acetylglucosamine synthase-like glycosyltransferase